MEKELTGHIRKRLVQFIKKEMEHGYSLDAIKRVLLSYHHNNMIDEAIKELQKENFPTKHQKRPATKRLDREMFYEVVSLLQDYIMKQRRRGYEAKDIHRALMRFGHSEEAVRAAVEAVEYGKPPVYVEPYDFNKLHSWMFPVGVIAFLVFVFVLSNLVLESPLKLGVLFSPILLTMILLRGLFDHVRHKQVLLTVPVLLIVLSYAGFLTGQGMFAGIEAGMISGLNFLVAFFYSFVFIGVTPEVEETWKQELKKLQNLEKAKDYKETEEVKKKKFEVKVKREAKKAAGGKKTPRKAVTKKTTTKKKKKTHKQIEKEIEKEIKSGKHGLKPVKLTTVTKEV